MELKKIKVNVWFNHWFSAVYHIISLLKENENFSFHIIGSNKNKEIVYKNVCDEWFLEPDDTISDKDYLEFALKFCKEHNVELFFPHRCQKIITENLDKFKNINVKVVTEHDYKIYEIIEDKKKTYDFLKEHISEFIPEYYVANNFKEFKSAVNKIQKGEARCCYKLIEDEGARSFKVIDEELTDLKNIYAKPGNKISLKDTYKLVKNYSFETPFLLMPFLDGVEVSVDCLKYFDQYLIFPRYKTNKRYSEIVFNTKIVEVCTKIMDLFDFNYIVNIQFKKFKDRFYILELNARMSGGLQLTCEATKVNMPSLLMSKIYGIKEDVNYMKKNTKVVHIESPVIIK